MATIGMEPALTIEQFFLEDYNRLRAENERLKAKIAEMVPNGYGCFDLREPVETVRIETANQRTLIDVDYGITDSILEAMSGADDKDLFDLAIKTYGARSYYSVRPITVSRHTYHYQLRFIETKSDITVLTDGNEDDTLVPLFEWDADSPSDNLGVVMPAIYEDELRQAALDDLRAKIRVAIEKRADDAD